MAESKFQAQIRPPDPAMPDVAGMRLAGEVDYEDASALRDLLVDQIDRTDAESFVLELSGVRRLDTAGAAVLVEGLMRARGRRMRMLLCSPSESVTRMFQLGGFEEVLEACCPNPAETMRRLNEPAA
jgi:anti-anti-sigma factor